MLRSGLSLTFSLWAISLKKNTPSFVLWPCLAPAPCGLTGTCSCACSWWLCHRWTSCLQLCSPITAKPPEALSVGAEGHMVWHTVPVRPPYVLLAVWVAGVWDWRPSVVDGSVAATPSWQALLRGWEEMWKTTQTPNSLLSSARRIGSRFLNFMFCGDKISEAFVFKAISWSCLPPGVKGMCRMLFCHSCLSIPTFCYGRNNPKEPSSATPAPSASSPVGEALWAAGCGACWFSTPGLPPAHTEGSRGTGC